MYVPASFRETDRATLHAFLERHSFAVLASVDGNELEASHLPLLLDGNRGEHGTLVGHMARANLQWKGAAGRPVLAVFHGPHAYISPTWYAAENVVPTWNYVAVHVYGTLRLVEDRTRLLDVVRQTVERYESPRTSPWRLETQNAEFVSRLLDAIVGFEIEIDRIEGKWKLNQNHDADRRRKVISALRDAATPDSLQIAELMDDTL